MAGFYETLLAYQNASPNYAFPETRGVFGQAATTPSIVAMSNDNINNIRNSVNNIRNSVNQAQNAFNAAQKKYSELLSAQPQQYAYGNERDYDRFEQLNLINNPAYKTWKTSLDNEQANMNNARTALQKNQTELQSAIARQGAQIAAGQDAVNWGLAAKAAEQQGLQNAMQAYRQTMANEGARNAIMNAAISTVSGGGR
ncbi:hypothetical protein [Selenomonas sp. AE3005]|uniref:hypothetical protein n=1 Tax=Selenomonas sp. AE3005 TaxID=1485543 RepID=UPI0004828A75|nr:hypothetical protein [Selenomonas sp. AE3005]